MRATIELEPKERGDGYDTVSVAGELDLSVAPELAARLADANGGGLLIDLSECTFIDSTGVSILLNASRRQTRARQGIAVVCPNPTPLRVFKVTGTVDTLQVVTEHAQAKTAIDRSRRALAHARRPLD